MRKGIYGVARTEEGGVSMERLTYIDHLGWYANGNGGERIRGQHIDRLAAYEDTGLAPEEISDAVIAAKLMAKSKIVSCFGVDADHIRELVQAEQDGRLVVLPCKVGDTVYQIDAERVYESEVKWIIFDCDDIAFDERAIGGSIFLTREEAEAVLKGGEG